MSTSWKVVATMLPLSLASCGHGSSVPGPSSSDVPVAVGIDATVLTSGVAIGPKRRTDSVPSFKIARSPVTVAEFRDCVSAGACSAPADGACLDNSAKPPFDRLTTSLSGADSLPATCVGVTQAEAFCSWVGGQLPSLKQFMLAARGPSVQRFPWGDARATCPQHPEGSPSLLDPPKQCDAAHDAISAFRVGAHPAGSSPLGVQDVLLAPGELIAATDPDAWTPACAPPYGACVAHGLLPGAIDGFEPVPDGSPAHHAYSFRCVWN